MVTVCSLAEYAQQLNNSAAVIMIDDNLDHNIDILNKIELLFSHFQETNVEA